MGKDEIAEESVVVSVSRTKQKSRRGECPTGFFVFRFGGGGPLWLRWDVEFRVHSEQRLRAEIPAIERIDFLGGGFVFLSHLFEGQLACRFDQSVSGRGVGGCVLVYLAHIGGGAGHRGIRRSERFRLWGGFGFCLGDGSGIIFCHFLLGDGWGGRFSDDCGCGCAGFLLRLGKGDGLSDDDLIGFQFRISGFEGGDCSVVESGDFAEIIAGLHRVSFTGVGARGSGRLRFG